MTKRTFVRLVAAAAGVAAGALLAAPRATPSSLAGADAAQDQAPVRREFSVVARKYAFEPARIEVNQDDLVKITLRSGDIAHSFTIDGYRIAKRVGAGQTVTFEFRADQAGTFPIYCSLRQDDGCRQMRGELVVRRR
jgi:heme/copper-type cytochrome/quinol oxidase subunit 2